MSVFVNNEKDPLYFFNDAAFHTKCVKTHELGKGALNRQRELWKVADPKNLQCFICKRNIENPDDYFTFGFLPSEEHSEVVSYRNCHISCLKNWDELRNIYDALDTLYRNNKWVGKGPTYELKTLKTALENL